MNAPVFHGCHITLRGLYRPLALVAHGRIFFSGTSFPTAEEAIIHARRAVLSEIYLKWHSHTLDAHPQEDRKDAEST